MGVLLAFGIAGTRTAEAADISLPAAGDSYSLPGTDQTVDTLSGVADTTVSLGSNTLTFGDATNQTFAGSISGTGTVGIVKVGAGTQTLTGVNTYTGETTISVGTLVLSGAGSLSSSSNVNLVNPGSTFDIQAATGARTIGALVGGAGTTVFLGANTLTLNDATNVTFDGTIGGTGGIVKQGAGIETLTGTNTYTGGTTINDGTLALGTGGSLAAGGSVTLAGTSAVFDISSGASHEIGALSGVAGSTVSLGGNTLSFGGDNSDQTFAGTITGSGGSIIKQGTGTMTLTGANTYTGGTTLNDGGLVVGNNAALGTGALTVGDATKLDASTATTLANSVLLNADLTVLGSNNLTLNGSISGTGALTKEGAATLTLNGTNTYTGGTNINAGTLALGATASLAAGGVVNVASGATLDLSAGSSLQSFGTLTGSGTINVGAKTLTLGDATDSTFSVAIAGAGGILSKNGTGTLTLTNASSFTGGTLINVGTLALGVGGSLASTGAVTLGAGTKFDISASGANQTIGALAGAGEVALGANTLTFGGATNASFAGVISGSGGIVKAGSGIETLTNANTFTGGTTIDAGTLALSGTGSLASTSAVNLAANAALDIRAAAASQAAASLAGAIGSIVELGVNSLTFGDATDQTFAGSITGTGGIAKQGSGIQTLTGASSYSGGTALNAGGLVVGDNAALGTGALTVNGAASLASSVATTLDNSVVLNAGLTVQGANSLTLNGVVSGAGSLTKSGTGTLVLSATNTYTGATIVNGGTLQVDGILTGTSSVNINTGGILSGTGNIDPLTVSINSGATFAPGNGTAGSSITVTGNLALASGAIYSVQLDPNAASFANVTGTATLGGAAVHANFASSAPGAYVEKRYTILTAAGGVSGTFSGPVNTNLPTNFHTALNTDSNNAYLDLALDFTPPPAGPSAPSFGGGLNGNQQRVASTLVNFFNANNGIPLAFGALQPRGLTQVSGEVATTSQQTTFDAMNLFMTTMMDWSMAGRGDMATPPSPALGYAGARDAHAMVTKAPLAPTFEQRWNVWATGFGGSQTTDGNSSIGSNTTTSQIYGGAAGADYRLSPDTLLGFALAGGGTRFSVDNGGNGHSDLFQAGLFARHDIGAAYVSGALAYGWQALTTDRFISADHLRAKFDANAFSGRIESGYRFVTPVFGGLGITPYAAGQVSVFDLPGYAEQAIGGSNIFALNYGSKSVTDTRSELGLRTDKSFMLDDALLTLRGRAAWAHDFNTDRVVAATFQTLPGASFAVNGAAQASDSALVGASAETTWRNGWSIAATFEGEFSNVTTSLAGKGTVRYAW
jgi:fibronectin-binding autotransporter adhesin